jgi:hypothetical protein
MYKLRSAYENVVLNETVPYTYTKNQFSEEDLEYYLTIKLKKDRKWFSGFNSWLYRKAKEEKWTTTNRMKDIISWLGGYINDIASEIEMERINDLSGLFKAKKIPWDVFAREMEKLNQGAGYDTALESVLWGLAEEFEKYKEVANAIQKGSEEAGVNLDI